MASIWTSSKRGGGFSANPKVEILKHLDLKSVYNSPKVGGGGEGVGAGLIRKKSTSKQLFENAGSPY